MSEKTKAVWQDLPDLIFRETMMLLNLEELPKCRQVCKIWNVMIYQMTKNKKNTIWRKAESLATQIGYKMDRSYKPHLAEILPLASMAHHGIPISVKQMFIQDVNCDVVSILLDNNEKLLLAPNLQKFLSAQVYSRNLFVYSYFFLKHDLSL